MGYDKIQRCRYKVPTYWEIGEIYARLILNLKNDSYSNNDDVIDILFEIYNSWIEKVMDNYNSSFYYDTPEYHLECYKAGEVIW
ncbi:MAG: hypothetical protein ACRC7N_05585 [Clostridium sp.]